MVPMVHSSYHPKRHLDRFSSFCIGPKCSAVGLQCNVNGEENPQKCPFPLVFRHTAGGGPSHGNRQHAQKWVNIAYVVRKICWRTDRHTHWRAPYNATAHAGEVLNLHACCLEFCFSRFNVWRGQELFWDLVENGAPITASRNVINTYI